MVPLKPLDNKAAICRAARLVRRGQGSTLSLGRAGKPARPLYLTAWQCGGGASIWIGEQISTRAATSTSLEGRTRLMS
jgi:hypothetical protein